MFILLGPLAALTLICAAFACGALLRRFRVDPELTRKATHLTTSLASLSFPWLLQNSEQLVALVLMAVLLVKGLRRAKLLGFLDDVQRSHLSEYAYIAGLGVVFALSHRQPIAYASSILILGVCDSLAAIVGKRVGRHRYRVFGAQRSLEGSLALAGSAVLIQVALGASPAPAVLIGLVLAVVEAVSIEGLDNFTLPVVAVVLQVMPGATLVEFGLESLVLVAPALAAGVVHQFVRARDALPSLRRSIDDVVFAGRLVFGRNKTLRGLLVVPVVCAAAFFFELVALRGLPGELGRFARSLPVWGGVVVGCAQSLGELPNSWLKRRLQVAPGQQATRFQAFFFALDHLDSAAACALAFGWLGVQWPVIVTGLVVAPLAHVAINRASFALRIRESAW